MTTESQGCLCGDPTIDLLLGAATGAALFDQFRAAQEHTPGRRRRLQSLVGALTLFATLAAPLTGIPASADTAENPSAAEAEAALIQADVLPDTAVDQTDTPLESDLAIDGSRMSVTIPADPSDGVSLIANGQELTVAIPGAAQKTEAVVIDDQTVVYENTAPGVSLAVQSPEPNVVQALIMIDDDSAPTTYAFPIDLPDGGSLEDAGDGSIDIVDENGVTVAFVAPAWAKDANGGDIPTSYEIVGTTLVQHVDHQGTAYPVVADPWVQGDCGFATCTIRFNRTTTRNARDAGYITAVSASACATVAGAFTAGLCAVVIAPAAVGMALVAGRYYEDGDCLGIRLPKIPVPTTSWPIRVNGGSYNC